MPIVNLSRHAYPEPRRAAAIIYRHILLGENSFNLIHTRAHEKIQVDFFRAEPAYVLYITGKNVKNYKMRSRLCALNPINFSLHLSKAWWQNMVVRAV